MNLWDIWDRLGATAERLWRAFVERATRIGGRP